MLPLWAIPPTVPGIDWWDDRYGPLGVAFGVSVAIVVVYIWWIHFPHTRARQRQQLEHEARVQQQELEHKTETERMDREHAQARQELDIERERKGQALFDTIRVAYLADAQWKERQAAVSEKIGTLTEQLVAQQREHAQHCATTHDVVKVIAGRLQASPAPLVCQSEGCHQLLADGYRFDGKHYVCNDCADAKGKA